MDGVAEAVRRDHLPGRVELESRLALQALAVHDGPGGEECPVGALERRRRRDGPAGGQIERDPRRRVDADRDLPADGGAREDGAVTAGAARRCPRRADPYAEAAHAVALGIEHRHGRAYAIPAWEQAEADHAGPRPHARERERAALRLHRHAGRRDDRRGDRTGVTLQLQQREGSGCSGDQREAGQGGEPEPHAGPPQLT